MDTLLILITSTFILFSAQFSYSVPVSEDVRDRWSDGRVNLTDSLVTEIVNGIRSGTRLFYVRLRLPPPRGFCGGSIIDTQWVLTSTKCLDLFAGKLYVLYHFSTVKEVEWRSMSENRQL